jgi:hypothetical protein
MSNKGSYVAGAVSLCEMTSLTGSAFTAKGYYGVLLKYGP